MNSYTQFVAAGEFKAHCLELMDTVNDERKEYVITKRGVPVARLVPVSPPESSPFGFLKDTVLHMGDILAPIDVQWDAVNEKDPS